MSMATWRRAVACGVALYLLQGVPLSVVLLLTGGDPMARDDGLGLVAQLTDPVRGLAVLGVTAVLLGCAGGIRTPALLHWRDEVVVGVPLLAGVTYCAVIALGWGLRAHSWDAVAWALTFTATPLMAGWVAAACALVFVVRTPMSRAVA